MHAGVYKRAYKKDGTERWETKVYLKGKGEHIYQGRYSSAVAAALAHDVVMRKEGADPSELNFPDQV